MLEDTAPRLKPCPPSRGSSFYIENLLGTTYRGTSAEERETPSFKVTVHGHVCPGLGTKRLDDGAQVLNWSGTSPNTAHGTSSSECICRLCVCVCANHLKKSPGTTNVLKRGRCCSYFVCLFGLNWFTELNREKVQTSNMLQLRLS